MQFRKFLTAIFFVLFLNPFAVFAKDYKPLTVKDIYGGKLTEKKIEDIQWLPDGTAFFFTMKNLTSKELDLVKHVVGSGEETVVVSGASLTFAEKAIRPSKYTVSRNGTLVLVAGEEHKVWRHSRQASHFLYDVKTKELTALMNGDPSLRNVKLSPDGNQVGYVYDFNIHVYDITTKTSVALTTKGNADVLHGEFDWVYEEEFGLADAWRWSPDGSRIAFWQIDQTRVKEFHLVDELPTYNTVFKLKYPKAGAQNALLRIGILDVSTGKITWVDLGEERDIYVPRIYWTNSSQELAVLRLNRLQNHLELLFADAESGETRKIIEDKNDTWIDVEQDILFTRNSDHIVWPSERSGYKHAYLYDYNGNLVKQITSGNWEISELAGIDEKRKQLYFYGKKDSPIENNVYRVNLDGSDLKRISNRTGWHTGEFSPNFHHVVGFFSDVMTPTQTMLRKGDGSLVRWLEENAIPGLSDHKLPEVEFLKLTTSDDVTLNAYMIKPPNFDLSKKYPVLIYGYGGPESQIVTNRWGRSRMLWHQMIAEKGYVVFCIDNRGTGGQGKAFKDLAYRDLSKWSVHDQIEGIKYLHSLPYVDKERIGFWGKSGGGYLTLMMMGRAAEYLKMGMAVAPVSDFHFYDTIWTERYMGLPSENEAGYRAANVLEYLDGLQGKLLLIHGTGDDNVHFQNSMHVIRELQKRGKLFDLMIYPNSDHSFDDGTTDQHWFATMTQYVLENL